MTRLHEKLGSWVLPRELGDIGQENTTQYDLNEDGTQNEQTFSQLAEEIEPCKKWQITMQEQIYYYLDGTRWQEAMQWHGVMMPIEILWIDPMQIHLGYQEIQVELAGGEAKELTANMEADGAIMAKKH